MNRVEKVILFLVVFAWALSGLAFADVYKNSRFGFSIVYPQDWNIFKNPAPENGDGISFSLPGNCAFTARAYRNTSQNSLENEIKFHVKDGTITREGKFSISGIPAKRVIFRNKDKMTIMYMAIKNDIVYISYYSGPMETFSKNGKNANKALSSFSIR